MSGYLAFINIVKDINPWVVLIGGVLAILVGIANLIKFYAWWKDRQEEKRNKK